MIPPARTPSVPPGPAPTDTHDLYLRHRDVIEAAIAAVCRKQRLPQADAEDFGGDFRLRLVREDYATLKRFRGESSLRTYLLVVVTRAFQDWRIARWGKWRASAEACRLGPLAERAERLIVRDGHNLDEVCEILQTNLGAVVSRAEIEALAARFPARQPRLFVADDALSEYAASGDSPDDGLEDRESALAAKAATGALGKAVGALEPIDRIVLRMKFSDCLAVSDIARTLGMDQKGLYRRIDRLLVGLRRRLEAQGLTADAARLALARGGLDFRSTPCETWLTDAEGRRRTSKVGE